MVIDDIQSREALSRYIATTGWPEFLFFWGHTAKDGAMGKHVLSQWWATAFNVAGTGYVTAEHYMMAEKARLFGDGDSHSRILSAQTPAEAKKLGRGIKGFDEARWAAHRFEVAFRGNLAKFGQNSALRNWLIAQNDVVFVEASPVDVVWGVGLAADSEDIHDPDLWRGQNLLGFALVKVMSELLDEDNLVVDSISTLNRLYGKVRQVQSLSEALADEAISKVNALLAAPKRYLSSCTELVEMLRFVETSYEAESHYMGGSIAHDRALGYAQQFKVLADQVVERSRNPQ